MIAFAIFVLLFANALSAETVKYAAVIFRHGDRTPVSTYPLDPWRNESLWPVKFGELTNTGKQQHYALGKWLRKRYAVGRKCYLCLINFSLNYLLISCCCNYSLNYLIPRFLINLVYISQSLYLFEVAYNVQTPKATRYYIKNFKTSFIINLRLMTIYGMFLGTPLLYCN